MRSTLIFIVLVICCGISLGAEPSTSAKVITVSLDSDLIEFFKTAIWVAGIFLALYVLIGIVFFGWDVGKARSSIMDARKDVKEQLKDLQDDYAKLKDLKEKLEELGAKLQETTESSQAPAAVSAPQQLVRRTSLDLIREVISSSNYEWTTIGRIIKKTGLSREDILREARSGPDIEIGHGRQTNDYLLKFKNAS